MKVVIKAGSQEEFDAKRPELIKAIAGTKYNVTITPKDGGSMEAEKDPFYVSQADILEAWDSEFFKMLEQLKHDISGVIEHG